MMIRTKTIYSHKRKSDVVIQRGSFNSYYFNFSNKFYKDTIFKTIFKLFTRFLSKFGENKILNKTQLITPILKRFKIDNSYIEKLISKFSKILNETIKNENLNPKLKSNIKLLPMLLIDNNKLGVSLVVELCLSHYKMIYMNENEESYIKIFEYPKLNAEFSENQATCRTSIIEHLGQCIIDFVKHFDTSSVKVLPIILIKNDEQNQLKRSSSLTEEDPDSQKTLFQIVYDMVDDKNNLNGLQTFLDQITIRNKDKEDDKSYDFVRKVFYETEDSESVDSKFEAVKSRYSTKFSKRFLVCATIDLTMASFLANYFYDKKCELLVNLNTELKFSFYDSSIEKLVCITFNKLFESSERKNSNENNSPEFCSLPNVYSILTAFDLEFDDSNDGKEKYFNNLIGILNQCELVRLILIDLMMYGVLFEKDYRFKGVEIKNSLSEIKYSAERRPIITEKIIKKHNPNIKLYIKYCLHTKLYSDIENDTSCNLNKVEKVLKDLGLKRTSYFDRIVTKSICKSITKRSAQILAGLIATVFKNFNSNNTSTCIGLDGMIFKSRPIFNAYLEYYLNFYMKKEIKYYLKISRSEYSLGAAYAIVFVLDRKLREETLKSYFETINNLSCKQLVDDQVDLRKTIFSKVLKIFSFKK